MEGGYLPYPARSRVQEPYPLLGDVSRFARSSEGCCLPSESSLVLSAPGRIRTCEAEASDLQSDSVVRLDNDASAAVQRDALPSRNVPGAVGGARGSRCCRSLPLWGGPHGVRAVHTSCRCRWHSAPHLRWHLRLSGVMSTSPRSRPGCTDWGWHPSLLRMTVPAVAKGSLCSCHWLAPGPRFQVLDNPLRAL